MEQGEVEEENAREEMHSLGGSNAFLQCFFFSDEPIRKMALFKMIKDIMRAPLYYKLSPNGGKHLANPHHAKDHECEELISPIEFDQEENHPHHDRNENEVLQHVTEY